MHRGLANILSYVFHPLLMATMLMVVLYLFTPTLLQPISHETVVALLTAVFFLTFLIPVISVSFLKITKSISSFKLERREERVMPFLFIAVYYGLSTYLFAYKLRLSEVVVVIFGSISVVILIVALLSTRYKISAHAAGAWGVAGFLTALHFKFPGSELLWPIVLSFVMSGAISSARLALNSHSQYEVYTGALLGFVVSFCSIFIFT